MLVVLGEEAKILSKVPVLASNSVTANPEVARIENPNLNATNDINLFSLTTL
jgi:hypothetical protein